VCGKLLPKPVENKGKILPASSRWRLEVAVTSKTAGLKDRGYRTEKGAVLKGRFYTHG